MRLSNGKGTYGMNEVVNAMDVPSIMMELVRQAVPAKSAWYMFLTGKVFDAAEALKIGLVDEIVAPSELLARAVARASYSAASLKAYALIKAGLQRPALEAIAKAPPAKL